RIDKVSYRSKPIFESLYLGMPWTEIDYLMGPATCVPLYQQLKNNIRFDLSDYLIHFFRDVDLETGSHIYLPEHCGFNNQHHA
ncbi:UbiD family decarboxylase, partial [Salmonella enterica subsp. enterica serovar Montevideo]|nr:UbiD family decarboxylase [Salmonella enterica subsp. enterica serovar Montevideo]